MIFLDFFLSSKIQLKFVSRFFLKPRNLLRISLAYCDVSQKKKGLFQQGLPISWKVPNQLCVDWRHSEQMHNTMGPKPFRKSQYDNNVFEDIILILQTNLTLKLSQKIKALRDLLWFDEKNQMRKSTSGVRAKLVGIWREKSDA